jgi:hypothetical protein
MAEHYFFHDNDFVSTPNINNILLTLQDNSIVINFNEFKTWNDRYVARKKWAIFLRF